MTNKRKEDESDEEEEESEEEGAKEEPLQKKQIKPPRQFVDKRSIRKNITHEKSASSYDFEGKGLEWHPEDNNGVTTSQISKCSHYYVILRCKENHKHEILVFDIKKLQKCPTCPKYTLDYIRAVSKHVRGTKVDTDCHLFDEDYKQVWYKGKMVGVHIVAYREKHGDEEYYKGIKEGRTDIAHICGNNHCSNPDHLRQDTHKGNCGDRIANGTNGEGEKNVNSKLKDSQRLEIYNRKKEGENPKI